MVSIQHLTKQYGQQLAIDDLNFEVKEGEILGFLGPNGAGKSTTMKLITGFISPTQGTVVLDGYDVQTHPLEVRRRVGYLPEHNPLYLDMYVHEFLAFAGRIYGLRGANLRSRIAAVIERTGLGIEQHKKIGMLSKGYRQRVGLCQALIHDPEVLILDEPTSGLDPNQVLDIRGLIQEVGRNKTVIFSSHILSEVEAVAGRILIINRGKLIADAPKAQIRDIAGNSSRVRVELEGPPLDPAPIAALPGVKEVIDRGDNRWEIIAEVDADIRRGLFQEVVAQGQVMLHLEKETYTLEEAFRLLTSPGRGPAA